jgi:hypothetical protein
VSASIHTLSVVACDYGAGSPDACTENRSGGNAVAVRRRLRSQGWAVNVPADTGPHRRVDYCPKHNPKESR